MSYAGRIPEQSEILELARAMAKADGLSYADELKDDAPSLAPHVAKAESILSGRHELETAIWEALEPFLEGPIQLDLNDPGDNLAFGHIVSQVASAVISAGEESLNPKPRTAGVANDPRDIPWFWDAVDKSREVLSKISVESLPSFLRERLEAASDDANVESLEPKEEIEYDYADADVNGHVMTNPNESMAYLGATTRMRRRKAGKWEPVPQDGDS